MAQNVHLLVCIHGLWGNPNNLAELAQFIRAKYPISSDDTVSKTKLDILVTKSNTKTRTYDGIDWGAERVADEVQKHLGSIQEDGTHKVSRFSVVGYSLGGLLARYILGILYTCGFFDDVEPVNFVTISTPDIGLPRYPGLISACLNNFGPRLLSRSGKRLSLSDKWSQSQRPIIEVMADNDSVFFKALSLFPNIHIYANAVNDVMVPYLTSAIELEDPCVTQLNDITIDIEENYEPMIKTITRSESPPPLPPRLGLFSLAFFRSLKPKPLLLPVPVHIQSFIWIFTPVLVPLAIFYAVVRLSMDSHASRVRINDLKKGDLCTAPFVNSLGISERYTDQAITAIVDASSNLPTDSAGARKYLHNNEPFLSPKQRSLVASLNSLSQMRKHLVFIDVFNSHAVDSVSRCREHRAA